MPIRECSTNALDLAGIFANYRNSTFYRGAPHCTPLPRRPPPVGDPYRFPGCAAEGRYPPAQACRHQRAHREGGDRTRIRRGYSAGRPPQRTDRCPRASAWRWDVAQLRAALRNPCGVARHLRDEAAAHRTAGHQQAPRGERPSRQTTPAAPEKRTPRPWSTTVTDLPTVTR